MVTFMIGLVILIVGGMAMGRLCDHVFQPDDRETPAYAKQDGVDYVPMPTWKNALINFLNIAGTGPILGPIQGILFGPIALLTIPIGNVIGGAVHDYFAGMICTRDGGAQMPEMVRRYTNKAFTFSRNRVHLHSRRHYRNPGIRLQRCAYRGFHLDYLRYYFRILLNCYCIPHR